MSSQETPPPETSGRGRRKFFILVAIAVVALVVAVIIAALDKAYSPAADSDVAGAVTADDVLARVRPLVMARQAQNDTQSDAMSRAVDIMAGYIETAPDDKKVRPILAETQIKLHRFEQAAATVEKLLELSPESSAGLWLKGRLFQVRGEEGSLELFRRAAEAADSGMREWMSFGLAAKDADQGELAREYLSQAVKAGLRDQRAFAVLGEISLSAGQPADAEYYFTEALKDKGADQHASLWSGLAKAQQAAGRPDEAVLTLTRATDRLRRWTDRAAMMVELADALAGIGRLTEAAEAYSVGSDGQPKSHSAALSAAKCYWQLGQYAQAMKYIDRAFELKSDSGEIAQWKSKIERSRFAPAN